MSKLKAICAIYMLLMAASCSDDTGAGPESVDKYTALKKANYSHCEMTLGNHTFVYDIANKDSFRFDGVRLVMMHNTYFSESQGSKYILEYTNGGESMYFDFVKGQILLFDYGYHSVKNQSINYDLYLEGFYHDTSYAARLYNIPFEISKDSVISANISEVELINKLIYFNVKQQDNLITKDSRIETDTLITALPEGKKIFKLKIW